MASSKTHRRVERPSLAQLTGLVKDKSPAIRRLYLDTHRLVVETIPDIEHSVDCKDAQVGYGARQYGHDGWGMAALSPFSKWVSLGFVRGKALDDPDRVLEGAGTTTRHLRLRSPEDLVRAAPSIRRFLKAAARLNADSVNPSHR